MTPLLLAALCGAFSGLSLGLIGGGGSVLAVPMLIYVVGLPVHLAIGTSALAVAVSAAVNLATHARCGHVRWRTAGLFALAGAVGAYGGSTMGKAFDGGHLLFLFGLVMMTVALLMARRRATAGRKGECFSSLCLVRLGGTGAAVGGLAGFFGIGGGFLVVPGLVFSTGMPMVEAIGSSLLSVGAFGLTTAANYALSRLVDWPVAAAFIGGGFVGGLAGVAAARSLADRRGALNLVYALMVFGVGVYVAARNLPPLG
ncbi:MAG: sulfite exporter TauE/SafE family protein [Magnetospirillum sp.]|nr:sulfite exporter TauE/SafE family protein [Magnetospirillum sp.]